jgi:AraC-like DNA-binding protein
MEPTGFHINMEAPLNEVIAHIYCIQTPQDFEKTDQHLSPNLEMMLIFNFGKPVNVSFADEQHTGLKIHKAAIIGPLRKMLNYELLPESNLLVIVFNADGFYRLFQVPMNGLGEEMVTDADKLLQTTGFLDLWTRMNDVSSQTGKIELLKVYVTAYIKEAESASTPLLHSIPYFNNPSMQPVRAIAMDSDLSERTIQLRFKKYLGYSPKELLRFLRFKQVIHSILNKENTEVDWYGLIEEFGYHDQSHLIKDFHHYLGTTPQKFVKEMVGKEFCVSREGKFYS